MKTRSPQLIVTLLFAFLAIFLTGCAGWSRTEWRYKPDRFVQHSSRMYGVGASEFGQPRGPSNYDSYMATSRHVTTDSVRRYDTPWLYIDEQTGQNLGAVVDRDIHTNSSSYRVTPQYYNGSSEDPRSSIQYGYVEGPKQSPLGIVIGKKKH